MIVTPFPRSAANDKEPANPYPVARLGRKNAPERVRKHTHALGPLTAIALVALGLFDIAHQVIHILYVIL